MADIDVVLSKQDETWVAEPELVTIVRADGDRIVFHNAEEYDDCVVRFRTAPFEEADLRVPHLQMRNTTRIKSAANTGEYIYDLFDAERFFQRDLPGAKMYQPVGDPQVIVR